MTELEIEELEWNFAESDSSKEEESADDISDNFGEEVRDILAASEADQEIGNFKKEEVVIIEEIALLEMYQTIRKLVMYDIGEQEENTLLSKNIGCCY